MQKIEMTVKAIWETFTEEQKDFVYVLLEYNERKVLKDHKEKRDKKISDFFNSEIKAGDLK